MSSSTSYFYIFMERHFSIRRVILRTEIRIKRRSNMSLYLNREWWGGGIDTYDFNDTYFYCYFLLLMECWFLWVCTRCYKGEGVCGTSTCWSSVAERARKMAVKKDNERVLRCVYPPDCRYLWNISGHIPRAVVCVVSIGRTDDTLRWWYR